LRYGARSDPSVDLSHPISYSCSTIDTSGHRRTIIASRSWTNAIFLIGVLVWVLSAAPADSADESYVIGAADVLEIQVWDNKDLNQVVFVRPDGKVSLPLIGEVQAGGRTVLDLQGILGEAYMKSVKGASVTVIVKEIKSRPVYFIGGFAKPGVEQLTKDLTVLQAVSIGGGLLPTADGESGFILRGERRIPVDFTRLIQKGDVSQNVRIEVGDSIVVPVADAVFIHGEVKTPGAIKATGDLTVLKAISQAGGVTQMGATGRVEILRSQGDKRERIKVDLDKMMRSPEANPDIRLKPNDIIFVPQRLF
jgi:polysaccharide export outer membrane protein